MSSSKHQSKLSRRRFLQATAGGAAGLAAAPWFVPRTAWGANDRIAVGCIGVRNQGAPNLKRFQAAGCDIVAVCDVDAEVRAAAVKLVTDAGRTCQALGDFRELLDLKGVDAVVVTTPDHWHAPITIAACAAGKDVYCEKPLSLTVREGRRMVDAARRHERIVQTGSQQRSSQEFWQACTLVRNGALGKLERVLVGIPGPNHPGPLGPDTAPPPQLDYNLWLGPAPERPYNEKRVHYNFRFWWDYSGGQMTNFGAHHLDIAQWALGMDDSGPIAASGTATFHPQRVHEVTESCRITYQYANGVEVVLGQGEKDIPGGATFIGSQGKLFVTRGKLTADPAGILEQPAAELPIQLERSTNHVDNFLAAMRSREKPICDVEIGHRSATVCHLGNLVARLGRPVRWDPSTETLLGDDDAAQMLDKEYRSPWTHG